MKVRELIAMLNKYPSDADVALVENINSSGISFHHICAVGTDLQVEDFLSMQEDPSCALAISECPIEE